MGARKTKVSTKVSTKETKSDGDGGQTRRRLGWKGWRYSIAFGSTASLTALLTNAAILAWALTQEHGGDNNVLIYEGSERKMNNVSTTLHALITVLSTLLLAGGNACMQVMMAPTREEVNKAHQRGRWLDIGVSGLKNLFAVSWRRKLAWTMIAICVVPLHLFYNSIVFTTIVANNYLATLVTRDFPDGAPFNMSGQNSAYSSTNDVYSGQGWLYEKFQRNISALTRLENRECIQTFSSPYVTEWTNVLLVSNATFSNSILTGSHVYATPEESDYINFHDDRGWICGHKGFVCDFKKQIADASSWTLPWDNAKAAPAPVYQVDHIEYAKVEYCLAEHFKPQCKVLLNIPLLVTVLTTNAIQLLFVGGTLFMQNDDPLITTGDAIASFMANPDHTTKDMGVMSVFDVRKRLWNRNQYSRANPKIWKASRHRWARAVSIRRWILTLLACLLSWGLAFALLVLGVTTYTEAASPNFSFRKLLDIGFGINSNMAVGFFGILSTVPLILVANIPQLLISILYYLYSGIFTCMVISHEYSSYASATDASGHLRPKRKTRLHNLPAKIKAFFLRRPQPAMEEDITPQAAGLRVSAATGPLGAQRSTYFLNLPFRYAIPLLCASSGLHFFASQAIFYANVTTVNNEGQNDYYYWIKMCGWSASALLMCLIIGLGMILAMLGVGFFRTLEEGMPVAGSCSAVISAACHPFVPEGGEEDEVVDPEAARWAVSFGELGVRGQGYGEVSEVRKAGFGVGRVYQLVDGKGYI